MNNQCTDRDLLALEPGIFTAGGFDSQQLAGGTDGVFNGTTFTSASGHFLSAGIQPGMVICAYVSEPQEARSYEIVSVDSATALTISVLRASLDEDPIAPPPAAAPRYSIRTFAPQIAGVRATLLEKLRQICQAGGVHGEDFVDSPQFRRAVVLGTLSAVFTARASNATDADANWAKAEFYRLQHAAAVSAVRLARDNDGDGYAERTRTLGNVSLRRE